MYGRISNGFAAALVLAAILFAASAASSAAATREPMRDVLAAARHPAPAVDSVVGPRPVNLRAGGRYAGAGGEFEISSGHYGAAEVESVAATLRSLDHGPEMATLSVYVATPEEIAQACGGTVVACYLAATREMVVSGIDRAVAGVPRDFAIAHEYGHHIANSQLGDAYPAIDAGTIRWATYERVCQLTRRGRLFPGNQGPHYWQDPEEAFAQSYAHLNWPRAGVSWQYTPLLQPSAAALAKIHADIERPWSGPVETTWSGTVTAAPVEQPAPSGVSSGPVGIGAAKAVGDTSWVDSSPLRTPLDGPVSVSLQAPAGAQLALTLHEGDNGRALASARTSPAGSAQLSYMNCGHAALRLEVRSIAGGASFQAAIARP